METHCSASQRTKMKSQQSRAPGPENSCFRKSFPFPAGAKKFVHHLEFRSKEKAYNVNGTGGMTAQRNSTCDLNGSIRITRTQFPIIPHWRWKPGALGKAQPSRGSCKRRVRTRSRTAVRCGLDLTQYNIFDHPTHPADEAAEPINWPSSERPVRSSYPLGNPLLG